MTSCTDLKVTWSALRWIYFGDEVRTESCVMRTTKQMYCIWPILMSKYGMSISSNQLKSYTNPVSCALTSNVVHKMIFTLQETMEYSQSETWSSLETIQQNPYTLTTKIFITCIWGYQKLSVAMETLVHGLAAQSSDLRLAQDCPDPHFAHSIQCIHAPQFWKIWWEKVFIIFWCNCCTCTLTKLFS